MATRVRTVDASEEQPNASLDSEAAGGVIGRGRLAGKVALITGGNSGIGLATAKAFVAEGARVAISGRDQSTLEAAGKALGPDVLAVRADVTDAAQRARLIRAVRLCFGRLDVLFVNAGVAQFAPIDLSSEAHFDYVFDVNVKGAYFTVQQALQVLAPGASVILNGSVSGLVGVPDASVYSASKAAIRSLARTLSADLKDRGIRVNVISPGPTRTPIYRRNGLAPEAQEEIAKRLERQVPLGRFGDAREIAKAVVFLASDESSFFLGAELVADGGMSQL
jgi:NAD(P)-dependent dehydrogenase (short-subunit alcohol dehydrogenase family)